MHIFLLPNRNSYIYGFYMGIQKLGSLPKRYKRIKVKGHYRLVLRNPDGTFDKVKKWSSRKKKRR